MLGDFMEAIIYALVFVFFFGLIFYILRACRLERAFEQGKVFEIKMAYVILSLIGSFLVCEFIDKLLSFAGLRL